MEFILLVFVVSLKFIIPTIMLWLPLYGAWGNYVLDVIDGDILLTLGLSELNYQTIDKFADLYSYVIMLIVGWRWHIKRTVLVLFAYRLIGQILFFVTRDEMMFVYFQNFLEPLIMIYALLLFHTKSEEKAYAIYKKYFFLIWAIILIYKIWNEWYLHYANIDLSLLFFGFTGGK